MQGSTSAGGKVAKCASLKLCVAMVHTLRRLAPAGRGSLLAPVAHVFFPPVHVPECYPALPF